MALACVRAAAAAGLVVAVGIGFAEVPEVETHPHDPAKAKAEFEAARRQEKDLIAELTLLQAEYHQPGADKKAIAAKFDAARDKIPATKERLETAAFALAMADAKNPAARELCGLVIASRLKDDHPADALRLAAVLDKAGVSDGNIDMVAATAAMVLSRLDDAAAWLTKAEEHGQQKQKVGELRASIEEEWPKVAGEMARRKADADANCPRVTITTSKGDVVVELFEDDAPNTVANFISLVEKGFYDGTPFHRVIGGFMAQGGDPTGTGSGGPGHVIECECELPTARKHFLGSLSMAHAGKNTGGSQFFLTFRPTEHLDGRHTVFGRVIEGLDVLPKLTRTQDAEGRSMPGIKPDTIVKATVLRKRDHAYDPKTLPDPKK
ncbi:MAG: peptidylprolyl isomerase [Planctomycetia bacterium]